MNLTWWFLFRVVLYPFLIQTSYVPDEYWQSLEVAHYLSFGYGHLTWEWFFGLRCWFYPFLIYIPYRFLFILGLDTPFLIVHIPKVLSGVCTFLFDVLVLKMIAKVDDDDSSGIRWILATNWYHFYSGARTLSNSIEALFTLLAFNSSNWLFFAGIGCLIRPTNAIFWIPYLIFFNTPKIKSLLFYGSFFLIYSMLLDSLFYNRFVSSFLEFFKFNFLTSNASFYGTHPFHWYFTNAIPTLFGFQLPFFVIGLFLSKARKWDKYLGLCIFVTLVYSLLGHKEFRFIYPCLPIFLIYAGYGLTWMFQRMKYLAITLILLNLGVAGYFSLIHQRGALDVMNHLSNQDLKGKSILLATGCHTTPGYSHIHQNITLNYLECSPVTSKIGIIPGSLVSSDLFHENPSKWFQNNPPHHDYIVLFEKFHSQVIDVLKDYEVEKQFFHTLLVMESKQDKYMVLLKRKKST